MDKVSRGTIAATLGDVTIDGADGAIVDGTNAAIKATVLDLAGADPLAVAIVDAAGAQITSFGGGTQYTEDAAAAANPVGNALILVREDARAGTLVSADGDNVAARGNNKGEQYVIDTDANTKLTTISGSTDGIEGLLTTIDGDTGVLAGAVYVEGDTDATIAGTPILWEDTSDTLRAVSAAKPLPVSVIAALPAGTNGIGKLTANSGVDIGDVDVTSVIPGVGATNLGKAEDAVHASGDTGIMVLAVRQDSHSDLAADGDYIPFTVDADGGLRVSIVAGAGSGGTAAADDADFTDGTTSGTPAMGVYESTPTTVTDGDLGVVGITEDRRLKVLADLGATDNAVLDAIAASVAAIDTDATTIIGHVDGLEALIGTTNTNTGNAATSLALIDDVVFAEDVAAQAADKGIAVLAVRRDADTSLVGTDNDYANLQVDANGYLKVEVFDGGGSHTVDNAGTFAVQAASAGDVAHDGADSGNPVKVGGKATNVEPAVVSATGDRANLITDMVGKLIVLPYSNPENFVSGCISSAMTGTTSTSLVAAPASGLRNYLTQITVSNAHATVGTDILIQDGSGGTTLYVIPAAAVYGGATLTFPVPLRQPTTATAIYAQNVTTGASTKVSASGYKGA
jgi:hypothetical protein